MIGLLIGETYAVLSQAALPIEINNLLFELEFQKGSRTFTFKLPTVPINQRLFNFPEALSNADKEVFDREYEAYITVHGNVLYGGKFKLRSANRRYYEGFFKFDFGDITQFTDKKLTELLAGEVFTFANQNFSELNNFTAVGSNICFPTIKIGNRAFNKYPYSATGGGGQWGDTLSVYWFEYLTSPLLPQFRWLWIFELILKNMGYRIKNSTWNENEPDTNKACFFSNTTLKSFADQLPSSFNIAAHLPDLTVGQFLKETRLLFGLWFGWNSKYKQLSIYFYKDLLQTNEADDWTAFVNPDITALEAPYKGFTFQFPKDGNDKKHSEQPKELANYRIGTEIISFNNLPMPTASQANTVRLVRRINAYLLCRFFHKLNGVDMYGWDLFQIDPIYANKIDDGGTKITPLFSPLNATNRITYRPNTANLRANPNDTGQIKIEYEKVIYSAPANLVSYIRLKGSKNYNPTNPYVVAVSTPTHAYITANYTSDEDNVEFEWIFELDHFIPELDCEVNDSDVGEKKAAVPLRVFFYHGLKKKKNSEELYPFASAGNFLTDGLTNPKIAEFAFRWEGEDGLLKRFWQEYLDFFSNAVVYKTKAILPITVIQNLKLWQKKRINESNVFITKLSYTIGRSLGEVDIEFIKTGIASRQASKVCLDGQPCEETETTG